MNETSEETIEASDFHKHAEKVKALNTIETFNEILKNQVVLFLLDAVNYQESVIKVLKSLNYKKKTNGVYITLNKPSSSICKSFELENIDCNYLFFCDAVGKKLNERTLSFSPDGLSRLSIEITKLLASKKYDFILFDTVDAFLMYNKKESLEKFFVNVVYISREYDAKCILIGIKEALEEYKLHVAIERVSDRTLDLSTYHNKFDETFLRF